MPRGALARTRLAPPDNLMPYIAQVAVGRRPALSVLGDDYDTRDGTGMRDYIHVSDLARAHLAAVDWSARETGCEAFNLGTGQGASVLEMVEAFRAASGQAIPLAIAPRRAGDVAACYADVSKAARVLGWRAGQGLQEMCESVWHWQSQNPDGYGEAEEA
jgi:UDP-glucose 4-epimerase